LGFFADEDVGESEDYSRLRKKKIIKLNWAFSPTRTSARARIILG
jgi:hypothetical protein